MELSEQKDRIYRVMCNLEYLAFSGHDAACNVVVLNDTYPCGCFMRHIDEALKAVESAFDAVHPRSKVPS